MIDEKNVPFTCIYDIFSLEAVRMSCGLIMGSWVIVHTQDSNKTLPGRAVVRRTTVLKFCGVRSHTVSSA